MKKVLFTMMLAAITGLTSCSSDESAIDNGRTQTAQITLTLPDNLASVDNSTRAGGHADYVNSAKGGVTNKANTAVNFYVALYYGNNTTPVFRKVKGVNVTSKSVTFTPTVVMGETYKLVAWAEFAESAATEADSDFDFENINISQTLNDEDNDAYFYSGEIEAAGTMSATLKRPFGKLRLIAEDYAEMNKQTGKTVSKVKVTYKSARTAKTFNAITGKFTGSETQTELTGDLNTYSAETESARTLFADYIAVEADGAEMFPCDVTVTYSDNTTFTRSFTDDIPVKRNCLTTLTGNFFTTDSKLTLLIDEDFDEEETKEYTFVDSESSLINALTAGENVVLSNDIECSSIYTLETSGEIDLNGYTLTLPTYNSTQNVRVLKCKAGATTTIKNGAIKQSRTSASAVTSTILVPATATLVVEDVNMEIDGQWSQAIYPSGQGANVTIKNSTISAGAYCLSTNAGNTTNPDYCTVTIEGSTLKATETPILINTPSTIMMTDCTLEGGWQAMFMRGGTATLTDCTLTLDPTKNASETTWKLSSNWGSGNDAPLAALTIGNRSSSAYRYATNVTLNNTKLTVIDSQKDNFPALYAYANTEENFGTTLTYDNNCTFTGRTSKTVDTETVYDNKSIILGSTANITINGSSVAQ